ncbi:capsular polysaccharide biosynthesis protein [Labrys neptuniae]
MTYPLPGTVEHPVEWPAMPRPTWLPRQDATLSAFLPTRLRFPLIGAALGDVRLIPAELPASKIDGLLGWGNKPLARLARTLARMRGLPFWVVEDGFLRSVGLGKAGAAPISIIADDLGLHFDASRPSRLEKLLQHDDPCPHDLARARAFREAIVSHRLTKYNHREDRPPSLPALTGRRILLVDQVAGDHSLRGSGADAETFRYMADQACSQSGAAILVASHPDVRAGYARGHLAHLAGRPNIHFLEDEVSPHAVLDVVDEVWTVSSQLGFDALLRSIPVTTFGLPFYAGWGLTNDRADNAIAAQAFKRRTRRLGLDELVSAALLHYPQYVDPVTRRRTTPEKAVERLVSLRRHALAWQGSFVCVGFSRHKRSTVRTLLGGLHSRVRFTAPTNRSVASREREQIAVWGMRDASPPTLSPESAPFLRIEDGFIRSVGLGAELVPPSSVCIDRRGIYFDATRPSDLEALLQETCFDEELRRRAHRLRMLVVKHRITKYNLRHEDTYPYRELSGGRKILTIAGQVEDDASLRYGLSRHPTNIDFLKEIRRANPDAYIVYKEHPDILAGRRQGSSSPEALGCFADLVIGRVSTGDLLADTDEVHVQTSLFGFEALMRDKTVVCHGMPFYAGWGLTRDLVAPVRPRRILDLDALIAGALILYPAYVSKLSGLPCEVEDVLEEIRGEYGRTRSPVRRALARVGIAR